MPPFPARVGSTMAAGFPAIVDWPVSFAETALRSAAQSSGFASTVCPANIVPAVRRGLPVTKIIGASWWRRSPWRQDLERHLGRAVSGIPRGDTFSWRLGPKRGLSL
jgi:hypothetical protein